MTHDNLIDIAVGRSRKETKWQNKEVLWSWLVEKLATTHRTSETLEEYAAAKKPRQDEIKDIGGFVGGYLANGRRKAGSVTHRQLLTLDADFAKPEFWEVFSMLYDCAAVLYSTHKHTPAHPRVRLVVPLSREVTSDEYEALARRVAADIGIGQFDHTGYQPYRLMYWPSTSKNGVYWFEQQDGPWLDVDMVLRRYRDWRDSSEWPISDRENEVVRAAMKKQGDPLEKPGIVGAFCRTYTIHDAIDQYLSNEYEPCTVENRYTYKMGTTAGGLVTYEDKYAYSHHGTDPACEKLCNAFDLVRVHKFAHLDERCSPDTPVNRLPSYVACVEKLLQDPEVRGLLGAERLAKAQEDFADLVDMDEPMGAYVGDGEQGFVVRVAEGEGEGEGEGGGAEADDKWLRKLQVDGKGKYLNTAENYRLIMLHDPRLKGKLSMNLFDMREVALGHLPWRKVTKATMHLTDKDDSGLRSYIEKVYGLSHVGKTQDALNMVMLQQAFHPVRDYLDGCASRWDGLERMDGLFIDYLGAEDTDYVRAVTRCMMVAAVKRIYEPGCKFDNVLVLQGPEGIGKSTLSRKLGGPWFTDNFSTVLGKEAYEQIQGCWIVEMGEMAGLKKAEVEHVKLFVSKQEDRLRMAYGKRVEAFPRQCIFIGTTNDSEPLREGNGNRRFWVVPVAVTEPVFSVWADLTSDVVGQLWGEAVAAYRSGAAVYLAADMEQEARKVQDQHTEVDERVGMVAAYLETRLPKGWDSMGIYDRRAYLAETLAKAESGGGVSVGELDTDGDGFYGPGTVVRERVCAAEVWCEVLGGKQQELTKYNTKEAIKLIIAAGWKPVKDGKCRFRLYGIQRYFVKVLPK